MTQKQSFQTIAEMKEFASFTAAEQRYIRRSLDIGLNRRDAVEFWARHPAEAASIGLQTRLYRTLLDLIQAGVPDDNGLEAMDEMLAPLITFSAFDLGEGKLTSFAAYRFLYERLIGAAVRPWLPSAFCAAAALPYLHPDLRKTLLQSLRAEDATAPGWSNREPAFYPEWVEKIPVPVS